MIPSMKSIYSPPYRSLLGWLRASRVAKGLSMREVGKGMGMPHSWVGKVETGERRLDVEEFVRLCRVLEIEAEQGVAILRAALPAADVSRGLRAAEPRGKYSAKKA